MSTTKPIKPRDLWSPEDWLDFLDGWTDAKFPGYQGKRAPGRVIEWSVLGEATRTCTAADLMVIGYREAKAQTDRSAA